MRAKIVLWFQTETQLRAFLFICNSQRLAAVEQKVYTQQKRIE